MGRKYKDIEPYDATSKQVDNRNRIFKATCQVRLHNRSAKLALKSDAVVSLLFLEVLLTNANTQDTLKVCHT